MLSLIDVVLYSTWQFGDHEDEDDGDGDLENRDAGGGAGVSPAWFSGAFKGKRRAEAVRLESWPTCKKSATELGRRRSVDPDPSAHLALARPLPTGLTPSMLQMERRSNRILTNLQAVTVTASGSRRKNLVQLPTWTFNRLQSILSFTSAPTNMNNGFCLNQIQSLLCLVGGSVSPCWCKVNLKWSLHKNVQS